MDPPPLAVPISPASRRSPLRGRAAAGWRTAEAVPNLSPGTRPYLQHRTEHLGTLWRHKIKMSPFCRRGWFVLSEHKKSPATTFLNTSTSVPDEKQPTHCENMLYSYVGSSVSHEKKTRRHLFHRTHCKWCSSEPPARPARLQKSRVALRQMSAHRLCPPPSSLCALKLASKRWAHPLSNNRTPLDDVIFSQSASLPDFHTGWRLSAVSARPPPSERRRGCQPTAVWSNQCRLTYTMHLPHQHDPHTCENCKDS